MDSDDEDDRYLDEVTRIKKASMLRKARLRAQISMKENKEDNGANQYIDNQHRKEVDRLKALVNTREESLKEANYTIRKLEERLKSRAEEEKISLLKEKSENAQKNSVKAEYEAKLIALRKQVFEKDARIDEILEVVNSIERNISNENSEALSSSHAMPLRTIKALLVKVRHGLINVKSSPAAPTKGGTRSKVASRSNASAKKDDNEVLSNNLNQPDTKDDFISSAQDKDITDALFDVCRHLEEENARLLQKLGIEGDPNSTNLPPNVKKLISFYRAAILRVREELRATATDLEREREISRGLRHQLRQFQLPNSHASLRPQNSTLPTKGSNPYVGEGRIPHWEINMSTASVAAEINELDSEIKHLQERLELAAVRKTQDAVAEALGGKGQ